MIFFKKKLSIFAVVSIILPLLFSQELNMGITKSLDSIPVAASYNNYSDFSLNIYDNASDLVQDFLENRVDMCILPVNIACGVHNLSSGDYQAVAITQNGNDKILTINPKLKKIEDFIGHAVSVPVKQSASDYIFQKILTDNKIIAGKEVHIDYSISMDKISNALINQTIESALVPEPFASALVSDYKNIFVAVDLQQEYEAFAGSRNDYPLCVMMINSNYAKNNSEIVKKILSEYEKSVQNMTPFSAAALCKSYNLGIPETLVYSSIKNGGFTCIMGREMEKNISAYLDIISKYDLNLIGGQTPDSSFYLSL